MAEEKARAENAEPELFMLPVRLKIMNKILCIGILAMLFLGIVAPTVQAISDLNQQLIEAAINSKIKKFKD
jgi:hypothetical protein